MVFKFFTLWSPSVLFQVLSSAPLPNPPIFYHTSPIIPRCCWISWYYSVKMYLPCIFAYWNQTSFINIQNMVLFPCEPTRLPESSDLKAMIICITLTDLLHCALNDSFSCFKPFTLKGLWNQWLHRILPCAYFCQFMLILSKQHLYFKEASSCLCCRQDTIYRVFCIMSLHRRYSVNIHWLIDHSWIYA